MYLFGGRLANAGASSSWQSRLKHECERLLNICHRLCWTLQQYCCDESVQRAVRQWGKNGEKPKGEIIVSRGQYTIEIPRTQARDDPSRDKLSR